MSYQNHKSFTSSNIYRYNINHLNTRAHSHQAVAKNSSFRPNLTQKSNLVQQSIESSNKLDELLKKCKQIGTICPEKNSKPDVPTQIPTPDNELRKINKCNLK